MAATDEPEPEMQTLEPEKALTLQDRLSDFIHEHAGELEATSTLELAAAILADFFRVEDTRNLYATSGVDNTTLEPFGSIHWGALFGRMRTDELRNVGNAFCEVAELADLEAAMARWLLRDQDATVDSVAQIIASFRVFRHEEQLTDVNPDPA